MKKSKHIDLIKYPVYEHLDVCLKTTYAERLQWLEDANEFCRLAEKSRLKMYKKKKTKAKSKSKAKIKPTIKK